MPRSLGQLPRGLGLCGLGLLQGSVGLVAFGSQPVSLCPKLIAFSPCCCQLPVQFFLRCLSGRSGLRGGGLALLALEEQLLQFLLHLVKLQQEQFPLFLGLLQLALTLRSGCLGFGQLS